MLYNVYSVLDVHTGYGVPVIHDNDATAMRAFENGCTDRTSLWFTHSSDFHLHHIGTFDTSSGELISCPPRKVCAAYDFVNMRMKENFDE